MVQLSELSFPSISSLSNRVLLPKDQVRLYLHASVVIIDSFLLMQATGPPIRLRNSLYNGNLFQVLIQTLLLLARVHKVCVYSVTMCFLCH